MKKHFQKTTASPVPGRIFRVVVAEDRPEVGIVFGIPRGERTFSIRAEVKKFKNERQKLELLARFQRDGFRGFRKTNGKIDNEHIALEFLADQKGHVHEHP